MGRDKADRTTQWNLEKNSSRAEKYRSGSSGKSSKSKTNQVKSNTKKRLYKNLNR